ncbi:MAG: hypothetical protein AB7O43_08675 [Hyphomicrobiaceae bacterium]
MQYVCDAPPFTWFRIETPAEAALEAQAMNHAVDRFFRQSYEEAERSYVPPKSMRLIEQKIGLKEHVHKAMPIFVTLRDNEGKALVTAMLPPKGLSEKEVRPIVVGHSNSDPYSDYGEAISTLGRHYGHKLDPSRCYPYRRG